MPYQKNKSEEYKAIGGINEEASTYATGDKECLKLENLDFQEPGAFTSRWGFTQLASTGSTIMLNNIWQISNNLPGFTSAGSNVIAGNNDALFGVSLSNGNFTKLVTASTNQTPFYNTWSHAEASLFSYTTNGSAGISSIGGFTSLPATGLGSVTWMAGITFLNFYKMANFGSTTGFTLAYFGLPTTGDVIGTLGITYAVGSTAISRTWKLGFYDDFRGDDLDLRHYGPTEVPQLGPNQFRAMLSNSAISTFTFYGLTMPPGATMFAPSGWALWGNNCTGSATDGTAFDAEKFYLRATAPISATQITDGMFRQPVEPTVVKPDSFYITETLSGGVPKYLEYHLSRLWIATDTLVFFSEISNPQNIPPFNYFPAGNEKFRTTGMKALHGNVLVFLQKGVKRIVGDGQELADGTTNFAIHDLTKEYGAVSHKSIVIFQERCWFLDENCIVEFNGANFQIVSSRIEPTMKTIDYAACKDRASGIHVPERKEVWFSVPVSGSIFNTVLVYDYAADAWTTFKGVAATCLSYMYSNTSSGQLNSPKIYFGTTLGQLNVFDSSFLTDNGTGFTCMVKGKFHSELGNSTQKIFRRVYVDGPSNGVTLPVNISLYADHATLTIGMTMTAYVGTTFQYRVDFGISAKSLSVELSHTTTSSPFKIYGYTLESRFARKV